MHNATLLHKKILFGLGNAMALVLLLCGVSVVRAATTSTSVTVNATVPAICGNGTMEGSETCDDGNRTSSDGCSSACATESGNNGAPPVPPVEPPQPPPAQPVCGNAKVESGESCDDGNTANGDGCSSTCQEEIISCKDQWANYFTRQQEYEVAVDGLQSGQAMNQTICTSLPGDTCDQYFYNALRATKTPIPFLDRSIGGTGSGASFEQFQNRVSYERKNRTPYCVSLNSAARPICGNNSIQQGETCDDGNMADNDGCSHLCQIEGVRCGNAVVEQGEQCDDGNAVNGDGCSSKCVVEGPVCGNRIVESGEECDDGNVTNLDGCSALCRYDFIPACINQWNTYNSSVSAIATRVQQFNQGAGSEGTFCPAALPGSVCDTTLYTNRGFVPASIGGGCAFGGSCDAWTITNAVLQARITNLRAAGPVCTTLRREQPLCGNGVRENTEQCDDGNLRSLDGCSNVCLTEQIVDPLPPVDPNNPNNPNNPNEPEQSRIIDALIGDNGEQGLGSVGAGIGQMLQRGRLLFAIANGSLPVQLIDDAVVTLPGDSIDVVIPGEIFSGKAVKQLILKSGSDTSVFAFEPGIGRYVARFSAREPGTSVVTVTGSYDDATEEQIAFLLRVLPRGVIIDSESKTPLDGVEVTLLDGKTRQSWLIRNYGQQNPVVVDGVYGFLVPNGQYLLRAKKDGYIERKTFSFEVANHVINQELALIAEPPLLEDLFDPDKTAQENIADASKIIGKQVSARIKQIGQIGSDTNKKIEETRQNPDVQNANKKVVAPTTVGVAVATVVPSLVDVAVPLFRYVFLQPILFVGRRKRQRWGQIYNSLTRLPVDLAMVRLVDKKTNRVLQSRVTDLQGRYVFIVEPGEYQIEVTKQGFQFPSTLLKGVTSDGKMLDIYHGESITSDVEGAVITPNIPLDPVGAEKKPGRIVFEQWLRATQHVISVGGIILTAFSLYVSPSFSIAGFLVVHTLLYGLFLRHVKPPSPKGWGIVADEATKQPVGRVLARLFTKEYNKLVSAQVTDAKGRYAFLVGPNQYYVTFEKTGYEPAKIEQNVPEEAEKQFINADVSLKSGSNKIV